MPFPGFDQSGPGRQNRRIIQQPGSRRPCRDALHLSVLTQDVSENRGRDSGNPASASKQALHGSRASRSIAGARLAVC